MDAKPAIRGKFQGHMMHDASGRGEVIAAPVENHLSDLLTHKQNRKGATMASGMDHVLYVGTANGLYQAH